MAVSRKKQWEMLKQQLKSQIERDTDNILFRQILLGEKKDRTIEVFVRDNYSKNLVDSYFLKKIISFIGDFQDYSNIDNITITLDRKAREKLKRQLR